MSMRWPTLISQTLETTRPFDEIMILVAWAAGIAASLILVPTALGVAGGGLAVLMIAIAVVDARNRWPSCFFERRAENLIESCSDAVPGI